MIAKVSASLNIPTADQGFTGPPVDQEARCSLADAGIQQSSSGPGATGPCVPDELEWNEGKRRTSLFALEVAVVELTGVSEPGEALQVRDSAALATRRVQHKSQEGHDAAGRPHCRHSDSLRGKHSKATWNRLKRHSLKTGATPWGSVRTLWSSLVQVPLTPQNNPPHLSYFLV